VRIGLVTDLHYRGAVPGTSRIARRHSREALFLLEAALERFHLARVDALVCLGDVVDDPTHPAAIDDLVAVRQAMDSLDAPTWVLPGNHDPKPGAFYEVFQTPQRAARLGDCEIIAFPEDRPLEGEEVAARSAALLDEEARLLGNVPDCVAWTLCLQHYLIWPERNEGYPHNYYNASAIREVMEASPRRILSLSGHYHPGAYVASHNGVTYMVGAALCEAPFPCYVLDLTREGLSVLECDMGSALPERSSFP
jgi:3',5'-cyclic AMP phosphodiesterase CpdA